MQRSRNWLGLVLLVTCFLVLSLRPASAQSVVGHQIDHGSALPTTCSASKGQIYFLTSGTVGLYGCKTDNTWTVTGGGFAFVGVLASIPATCTVGDLAFITNATAGQNIYECAATNTWTQQLNSGSGGASTALDNLASVSINTSLLAQTGVDAGSTTKPFRNLFLFGAGTFGTTSMKLTGTPTGARTWTLQDTTDTFVGLATADTLTNKTLTTPTIGSFANATHNHTNAAGGGTLTLAGAAFANQGTTTTILHGNGAGNPSFGALVNADITNATIDLTAKVTGILPSANGGTANGFTKFSGPATAEKTFTLPNASATVLTDNAAVTVAQGGTGLASGTSGGILAYTASGTLASSAALTANLPVIGGGAGVAPSVGTRSGNTTAFVTTTGTLTSGDCVKIDASGNFIANGSACGSGGGITVNGSSATSLVSGAGAAVSNSSGAATVAGASTAASSVLCEYRFTLGSPLDMKDWSGNGNDATLTASGSPVGPTRANSGLTFVSGNTGYVQLPTACNTAQTIEVFVAPDTASPATTMTLWGRDNNQGASGIAVGAFRFELLDNATGSGIINGTDATVTAQQTTTNLIKEMLTFTLSGSASTFAANTQASSSLSSGYSVAISAGHYLIGASNVVSPCNVAGSCEFTGRIYAVKMYSTVISQQEQTADYVFFRLLVLGKAVDADNSLSTTTSQLVCDGDSHVQGDTGGFTPWCQSMTITGSPTISNVSFTGAFASSVLQDFPWRTKPLFAPNAQRNIYVFDGCTNDINNGTTATACYASLVANVRQANLAGFRPVLLTMIPFTTLHDTAKNTLNQAIRTGAYKAWPDTYAVADVAALPGLGRDGAATDGNTLCGATFSSACFLVDHIHESTAASLNQELFMVQNVINAIDNSEAMSPDPKTTTYAMLPADRQVRADTTSATFTVTAPDCIGQTGLTYSIQNIGTNPLTVSGLLSTIWGTASSTAKQEQIDGATTISVGPLKNVQLKAVFGDGLTTATPSTNAGCHWESTNTTTDGGLAEVTSDFTTAANTNLQNITNLSFTLQANTAKTYAFECSLPYSQATAAVAVSFGISLSVAPTRANASGEIYTSTSAHTAGNLQGLTTTTATAVMTGTPSAITTIWNANLRGTIVNPSQAASTFTVMVKTATSGDAVTVKQGGFCKLF